jgi:hypothetical protein
MEEIAKHSPEEALSWFHEKVLNVLETVWQTIQAA